MQVSVGTRKAPSDAGQNAQHRGFRPTHNIAIYCGLRNKETNSDESTHFTKNQDR